MHMRTCHTKHGALYLHAGGPLAALLGMAGSTVWQYSVTTLLSLLGCSLPTLLPPLGCSPFPAAATAVCALQATTLLV